MSKFKPGDYVTVLKLYPLGHVRSPFYIRGKTGRIEKVWGEFVNPEETAYFRSGFPKKTLYRICFNMQDTWPHYKESSDDKIYLDIYEHWLKPATSKQKKKQEEKLHD